MWTLEVLGRAVNLYAVKVLDTYRENISDGCNIPG